MRELTRSILNGFDLDTPPDVLTFTVVQPPAHGSLINGIYGTEMSRYKDMGADLLQRSLPVTSFTLQELRQGERCSSVTENDRMMISVQFCKILQESSILCVLFELNLPGSTWQKGVGFCSIQPTMV